MNGQPPVHPDEIWHTVAQNIVEDAYAVLGYRVILLSRFDREAGYSQPVAFGGRRAQAARRATEALRRAFPAFDPWTVRVRWDSNADLRRVWERGETVMAPVAQLNAGINPPLVAALAGRLLGARHALVVPLLVDGVSVGSLTCFQASALFSERQLRATGAFARQLALSIENAGLAQVQKGTTAALEASLSLLAQAEERTRQSISEFLHSQVQSKLLVAWYKLGEIAPLNEAARLQLEEVRQELEALREGDVRLVSHLLHPEGLRMGLLPALQLLARRMAPALQVQITTDETLSGLDEAGTALPTSLRLTVFRTVEEALNNVLKHARAQTVTVWLTAPAGRLLLSVSDDGAGFDQTAVSPGLGLLALGARIAATRGRWGIESRPGGPTRLWADWALPPGPDPEAPEGR